MSSADHKHRIWLKIRMGETITTEAPSRRLGNPEKPDSGSTKTACTLRPVRDRTEHRVRGHIAVCVYVDAIETLFNSDLAVAGVRDPDLDNQHLSADCALREFNRIRRVQLTANGRSIELTLGSRPSRPEPSPP